MLYVVKNTICLGFIVIPIKLLFELLDPFLRFAEMAINILLAFIIGNIVDFINKIPSIGFIHRIEYRLLRLFILKICYLMLVNRTFSKKLKICPLKPIFMVYFYCRRTK